MVCVTARASPVPAAPVSGAAPTCPHTPGRQQTVSPSLIEDLWKSWSGQSDSWTPQLVSSLAGNQPPVLHPPPPLDPLRYLQGYNFSYQLQARDPEGLAVIFSLHSGPKGASLSPAGQLTWTVTAGALDTHTFLFTARDECGAETRASLQVNTSVLCCSIKCLQNMNFFPLFPPFEK